MNLDKNVNEVFSKFEKADKYSRSAVIKLFRLFLDVNDIINLNQFKIIFDVGANIGIATHILHMLCPNATIHSFEPIDIVFEVLERNIKKNNLDNCSKIYNFGIFSHENDTELFLPHFINKGDIVTYTFKKRLSDDGKSLYGDGHSMKIVKMKKLDNFTKENNLYPDFIKVDIEGAESELIKGGRETLKNCKAALIECCKDTRELCNEMMLELGYNKIHKISHHDILFIRS